MAAPPLGKAPLNEMRWGVQLLPDGTNEVAFSHRSLVAVVGVLIPIRYLPVEKLFVFKNLKKYV